MIGFDNKIADDINTAIWNASAEMSVKDLESLRGTIATLLLRRQYPTCPMCDEALVASHFHNQDGHELQISARRLAGEIEDYE